MLRNTDIEIPVVVTAPNILLILIGLSVKRMEIQHCELHPPVVYLGCQTSCCCHIARQALSPNGLRAEYRDYTNQHMTLIPLQLFFVSLLLLLSVFALILGYFFVF